MGNQCPQLAFAHPYARVEPFVDQRTTSTWQLYYAFGAAREAQVIEALVRDGQAPDAATAATVAAAEASGTGAAPHGGAGVEAAAIWKAHPFPPSVLPQANTMLWVLHPDCVAAAVPPTGGAITARVVDTLKKRKDALGKLLRRSTDGVDADGGHSSGSGSTDTSSGDGRAQTGRDVAQWSWRALQWLKSNPHPNLLPVAQILASDDVSGRSGGSAGGAPTGPPKPQYLCAVLRDHRLTLPVAPRLGQLTATEILVGLAQVAEGLCHLHQRGWMHGCLSWAAVYEVSPYRRWIVAAPHMMMPADLDGRTGDDALELLRARKPFLPADVPSAAPDLTSDPTTRGASRSGPAPVAVSLVAPELQQSYAGGLVDGQRAPAGAVDVYAFGGLLRSVLTPRRDLPRSPCADLAQRLLPVRFAEGGDLGCGGANTSATLDELHRFAAACQASNPLERPSLEHFLSLSCVRHCTLYRVQRGLDTYAERSPAAQRAFFRGLAWDLYKIPYHVLLERIVPQLLKLSLWTNPHAESFLRHLLKPLDLDAYADWTSSSAADTVPCLYDGELEERLGDVAEAAGRRYLLPRALDATATAAVYATASRTVRSGSPRAKRTEVPAVVELPAAAPTPPPRGDVWASIRTYWGSLDESVVESLQEAPRDGHRDPVAMPPLLRRQYRTAPPPRRRARPAGVPLEDDGTLVYGLLPAADYDATVARFVQRLCRDASALPPHTVLVLLRYVDGYYASLRGPQATAAVFQLVIQSVASDEKLIVFEALRALAAILSRPTPVALHGDDRDGASTAPQPPSSSAPSQLRPLDVMNEVARCGTQSSHAVVRRAAVVFLLWAAQTTAAARVGDDVGSAANVREALEVLLRVLCYNITLPLHRDVNVAANHLRRQVAWSAVSAAVLVLDRLPPRALALQLAPALLLCHGAMRAEATVETVQCNDNADRVLSLLEEFGLAGGAEDHDDRCRRHTITAASLVTLTGQVLGTVYEQLHRLDATDGAVPEVPHESDWGIGDVAGPLEWPLGMGGSGGDVPGRGVPLRVDLDDDTDGGAGAAPPQPRRADDTGLEAPCGAWESLLSDADHEWCAAPLLSAQHLSGCGGSRPSTRAHPLWRHLPSRVLPDLLTRRPAPPVAPPPAPRPTAAAVVEDLLVLHPARRDGAAAGAGVAGDCPWPTASPGSRPGRARALTADDYGL